MIDSGFMVKPEELAAIHDWVASLGRTGETETRIVSWRQGWGDLQMAKSIINKPLTLADKEFCWGLGSHADSEIVLYCSCPIKTFRAWCGVDANQYSSGGTTEVVFSLWAAKQCLTKSSCLNVKSQPERIEAEVGGVTELTLKADAAGKLHLAHADWAEAEIVTINGEVIRIGTTELAAPPTGLLPISFRYDSMASDAWFRRWGIEHTHTEEPDFILHRFRCHDRNTGLECLLELQEYTSFPACLWNVYFRNLGSQVAPLLEEVKTLNMVRISDSPKILHRSSGAFSHGAGETIPGEVFRDNYMMRRENLEQIPPVVMGGSGGRPSSDWMPFFNLETNHAGSVYGIGWTGQWQAQITAGGSCAEVKAGMANIRIRLEPGELIRQPSILMINWQGDNFLRGHNLLRRFITEYLLPRYDGKPVQAPTCNLTWGGMRAAEHLKRIANIDAEKIPFDYYWIDAGWYGKAGPNPDEFSPEWCSHTGDWTVDEKTYPHGLREISDAVHAVGKKILLWAEPERAVFGVPVTLAHPEWFLGDKTPHVNVLLNLGNPDARQWCIETIAGLIDSHRIDCYRQDFNINPLPFWQANDTPDRVGITEIRYVEGLYVFLAELRRRFPHLLIDNCASGGRRLDFEMMRYSIPLWASDMQCNPNYITERNQQLIHGLSYWLPQFAFGTQNRPGDTYRFRSTMAAGIIVHLFTYEYCTPAADYPYQWLRERLREYHRAKVYFSGDFYPLCAQETTFDAWTANQFHRPDLDSGILQVFRKTESAIEKMRLQFQGLANAAQYEIENADDGKIIVISGTELLETGFPVEMTTKPDSRLFFYRRQDASDAGK